MGLLDRFREGAGVARPGGPAGVGDDEAAIARYRYMLKTAPPETIEQAHAEAFAQLTPEQRQRARAVADCPVAGHLQSIVYWYLHQFDMFSELW